MIYSIKNKIKKSQLGIKLISIKNIYRNKRNIKKNIKGENNSIEYHPNCYFNAINFEIKGSNNKVIINEGGYLNNLFIYINGDNNIIYFDKYVSFNKSGIIHALDNNIEIKIGQHTSIEDAFIEATENNSKIIIGDDCMFSKGIELRTGDSHSIIDLSSKQKINKARNITIGNHVWIGADVIVLKGVNIANNTIIGIRSVLTKSFSKEDTIIAGNPPKIIKENVTWSRKRNY